MQTEMNYVNLTSKCTEQALLQYQNTCFRRTENSYCIETCNSEVDSFVYLTITRYINNVLYLECVQDDPRQTRACDSKKS